MIWLTLAVILVVVAVGSWIILMSGASDEELERDEREISAGRKPGASRT